MARFGRSFPIRPHINYQGFVGIYFNRPQTVTPSVLTATLATAGAPTIILGVIVLPSVEATTLALLSPTVTLGVLAQPNVEQLTLATLGVTVLVLDTTVYPNVLSGTLATLTPTIIFDDIIPVNEQTLIVAELLVVLTLTGVTIEVGVQETELTLYAGTYYAIGYFDKYEVQTDTYQLKY